MSKNKKLLQGNEACVEGALYAGCRFFAGYPITPSTEIAEGMSFRLPKLGGKFTLRLAIGQTHTEERHVQRAWDLIRETAAHL